VRFTEAPVGDLLDVGCGRGSILKLLASRARRAVGVDIDAKARRLARAELMLAGLPNCSLRQGDMYRLPFDDAEFNTIILDDVLADATDPVRAAFHSAGGQRAIRCHYSTFSRRVECGGCSSSRSAAFCAGEKPGVAAFSGHTGR
jgi:SAM-dependent methyltransferase